MGFSFLLGPDFSPNKVSDRRICTIVEDQDVQEGVMRKRQ
jgi:hypothetical protein